LLKTTPDGAIFSTILYEMMTHFLPVTLAQSVLLQVRDGRLHVLVNHDFW